MKHDETAANRYGSSLYMVLFVCCRIVAAVGENDLVKAAFSPLHPFLSLSFSRRGSKQPFTRVVKRSSDTSQNFDES